MEFPGADGKTIIGMDMDLAKAIGDILGVKVQVVNASFESILPGLVAQKYDMGMSAFTDSSDREKIVDFVTYFRTGTSFFTRSDGGVDVRSLEDLCGKTVAVQPGTVQANDAIDQNGRCMATGRPTISVQEYPDQDGTDRAVLSGRAQLSMTDSPVVAYQVKLSRGKLKIVGDPYGIAPYGIAVPKNSGLTRALLAALMELNANGTYTRILKEWGLDAFGIPNFEIKP
jgi:polar amino acid transport system substrate-binding protein